MAHELTDAELNAWLDGGAPVLALQVEPAFRDGIIANLRVIARLAALVDDFAIDDHEEPAALFRA